MTLNPRIVLACATCIIISGFIGSYKSFQIYKDQVIESQILKSQTVGEYAGQNIEQKLSQIEAAVSYLDQSTVETLKRFGVRYFAYSYLKNNEWSIKWKVLGSLGKDAILGEVKPIPFTDLDQSKRHWIHSADKQLIYITPVALAESHQLKEGFLIFGLQPEFFSSLKDGEESFALISPKQDEIFGAIPNSLKGQSDVFKGVDQPHQNFQMEGQAGVELVTASYLPFSQLWVVRQESLAPVSFTDSRFFSYFLVTSGLGLLVLLLLLMGRTEKVAIQPRKFQWNSLSLDLSGILEKIRLWIASFTEKNARQKLSETEVEEIVDGDVREIADFADFLDHIVAEEMPRLQKVGVSVKTLVEEGASVICSPQRVTDFLKRLIGNSVLSLESEDEKEIQIQMVEQPHAYQLIYVDTRTSHFPSHNPASLMAQTEGSLQGIDGIIAYAGWLFGERLTVAKKGFCLSIDLAKANGQSPAARAQVDSIEIMQPLEAIPFTDTLERIEIEDADTDLDLMDGFAPLGSLKKDEDEKLHSTDEPKVNFDDVIDQFRMKDFSFAADPKKLREDEPIETPVVAEAVAAMDEITQPEAAVELKQDDKGLFEFSSGQLKIKIRSPKKRESDVSR